jgi:hypothetical protein
MTVTIPLLLERDRLQAESDSATNLCYGTVALGLGTLLVAAVLMNAVWAIAGLMVTVFGITLMVTPDTA